MQKIPLDYSTGQVYLTLTFFEIAKEKYET